MSQRLIQHQRDPALVPYLSRLGLPIMDNSTAITAAHSTRLRRMADLLGLPIEAFNAEPEDEGASDLFSLLRLWAAVPEVQARRRVLSAMRHEAERAGYKDGG